MDCGEQRSEVRGRRLEIGGQRSAKNKNDKIRSDTDVVAYF